MRAATELMREVLADQDEYIESDLAFHLTIAEATQNRLILHLMHAIRDQLERALGSIYRISGSPEQSIEDHSLIIEAMAEGKPEEARARMYEHLGGSRRRSRSRPRSRARVGGPASADPRQVPRVGLPDGVDDLGREALEAARNSRRSLGSARRALRTRPARPCCLVELARPQHGLVVGVDPRHARCATR